MKGKGSREEGVVRPCIYDDNERKRGKDLQRKAGKKQKGEEKLKGPHAGASRKPGKRKGGRHHPSVIVLPATKEGREENGGPFPGKRPRKKTTRTPLSPGGVMEGEKGKREGKRQRGGPRLTHQKKKKRGEGRFGPTLQSSSRFGNVRAEKGEGGKKKEKVMAAKKGRRKRRAGHHCVWCLLSFYSPSSRNREKKKGGGGKKKKEKRPGRRPGMTLEKREGISQQPQLLVLEISRILHGGKREKGGEGEKSREDGVRGRFVVSTAEKKKGGEGRRSATQLFDDDQHLH